MVAIPNGIAEERIALAKGREATRAELGAAPDDFVVTSIGRLADGKGLDDLLEAVAAARGRISWPVKVWLGGDGPIKTALENLAARPELQGVVQFLGFRQDIGNLLAASDLIALPSLREGLSIALLEAMAMEKPIVATSIGSNREVTRDGECAHLVAPEDRAALAEAIAQMANDPEYAQQLAKAAGCAYRSTYTNRAMLNSYNAEYDKVLSGETACRSHWMNARQPLG